MAKPTPTPKIHAKDKSVSGLGNSLKAAFLSLNKTSTAVVVPHADLSKSTASSTAPQTALQNSIPASVLVAASGSVPLSIASAGVSNSHGVSQTSNPSTTVISNAVAIASDIFSTNASKMKLNVSLPKVGDNIETTTQLVACAELISRVCNGTSNSASASKIVGMDDLSPSQMKWTQEMDDRPLEKDYIRQLMNQMVDIFIILPSKTSETIHEIVLLGPVLDKENYRNLLNHFLHETKRETVLNISLLQGLVRLVECAPPLYLKADDLTKILRAIRNHLTDSAQQDTSNTIQLTVAISKVLVIMVDCGVKDLHREQEHKPLLEILSKLRKHADPLVRYQIEYAYRALQLVPDDETMTQRNTRAALGFVGGLLKVSGAIKLDFGGVPEGLPSVLENGRELADNLKKYFGSGDKNPWHFAVRQAEVMVNEGRLVDFNRLISNNECRLDPFFQWGVCLILGEMAIEPLWNTTTREKAIRLLGEMFKSNLGSEKHRDVRRWILTLLHDISELSGTDPSTNPVDEAIKQQALDLLQELNNTGDEGLFPFRYSHPAMSRRQLTTLSKLLKDDNNTLELELVIERLRHQRQEAYSRHAIYIPPMSKPNLQASDEIPDPLHGRVHQFLADNGRIMLILGDSGAGKSTFNARLEQDLWDAYHVGGPIPLLIDLKAVEHLAQNLIRQHLDSLNMFSASHMKILNSREFILICDGYDESQSRSNLYISNRFNKPNQWKAKMVISCRTQYLSAGYRTYFAPQQDAVADRGVSPTDLFTEAVIIPFEIEQIREYIAQYTTVPESGVNIQRWTTDQYLERLGKIANIMDLIKNPFMLRMILEILPKMSLTTTQITRVELYDEFVDLHYENELKRLIEQQSKMDSNHDAAFKEMEPLFLKHAIDFSKRLAEAIFAEGKGVNSVEYSSVKDTKSWKYWFFNSKPETELLREASQLVRRTSAPNPQGQIKGRTRSSGSGSMFKFSHTSILEYFYALSIYDPRGVLPYIDSSDILSSTATSPSLAIHPLGQQSLVSKPAILQFLADRAQCATDFKDHLHELVQLSKSDKADTSVCCAASNAITILIRAGERFNGADLRGIRVPGADLSCGDFDSAQLQDADLRNTILRNVWLHQADLSHSQMEGATFGQYPYLEVECAVAYCVFSPDGRYLAAGLYGGTVVVESSSKALKVIPSSEDYTVRLWDAHTGALAFSLRGHTSVVNSVAFSPSGNQIASGSWDYTVRLWDAETGALVASLSGHTDEVASVAYSPSGHQIASGSDDRTVRLWDAQTGTIISCLRGHTDAVTSVAYSPSGHQIASGSNDKTVRLWDAQTGTFASSLIGHTAQVNSVAYSPSGHQIASGSEDHTVRLWDTQTGTMTSCLRGHTNAVSSVAYSPSGHQITSGSRDNSVRLWDAQTGTLVSSLSGHTHNVNCVAYSPSGHQIATGSDDRTVRLWEVQAGALASSPSGHSNWVSSVAHSPSGHQIASGSYDYTVRLWDAQTGALASSLSGHTNTVSSVAYSPSGHQIASGSGDKTVRLWDAQTGSLVSSLVGHSEWVSSVAYSPSGHQIASGSFDMTVRLWDARTGALAYSLCGHTDYVTSVAYSPSGHQIASSSWDRSVRLWDPNTGTLASSLNGHTDMVTSVTYSPSGHQIATCSWDRSVRLWNAQTGALASSLWGHTGLVNCVAYSPSGDQIASGSYDETVRLWDVQTGECLAILGRFQDVINGVAWKVTTEGTYLTVGGRDKSVYRWKVDEDGKEVRVCLRWRSTPDTLVLSKASIEGTQGLSAMNIHLLQQRGALGQPIALLASRDRPSLIGEIQRNAVKLLFSALEYIK